MTKEFANKLFGLTWGLYCFAFCTQDVIKNYYSLLMKRTDQEVSHKSHCIIQ